MTRQEPDQAGRAAQIAAAFRMAIDCATEFAGATAPNPAVGCVLLDAAGNLLIAAAHRRAGEPHAEARALHAAAQQGVAHLIDTAVVTLEPCNHHGQTAPCSAALLASSVREVWYALPDPNPKATGGAQRLEQAGRRVHSLATLDHPARTALLADATRLLAPFATRIGLGRPFITVKQALDPTGSMIPPPGQKTFTGPAALTMAHQLRRRADAILTGSGTILADRPDLTVRHVPDIAGKTRILCILDRRGRVDAAYLDAATARGFRVMVQHDLTAALHDLAAQGCNEVLVEAGPTLTAAIHAAGLWDEWVLIENSAAPDGSDRITTTPRLSQQGA